MFESRVKKGFVQEKDLFELDPCYLYGEVEKAHKWKEKDPTKIAMWTCGSEQARKKEEKQN